MTKVTLPAGLKGWFATTLKVATNFSGGADVFEIVQPTTVLVIDHSTHWLKTVGNVPGFPMGHPALLINRMDLEGAA